jgi:hypothetical protein
MATGFRKLTVYKKASALALETEDWRLETGD